MTLGNYIINFMAIGLAISLLVIMVLICLRGIVPVSEPRKWVRVIELVTLIGIIGLGIYNLIEGMK